MSEIDKLKAEIKKEISADKEDYDKLFSGAQEVALRKMVDHQNCGDENCAVCGMKSTIRADGFETGVKKGLHLKQAFPKVNFVGP